MSVEYLVNAHNAYRTILFDLDNTLYNETDFLFPVYKVISEKFYPDDFGRVYNFLVSEFIYRGRKSLFDKLTEAFPQNGISSKNCLAVLRTYKCSNLLTPYPWFLDFLYQVGEKFRIRIITNGHVSQQKNKIWSINFGNYTKRMDVVYANLTRPKPHIESYFAFHDVEDFNDPIYIGDSDVDFEFSQRAGLEFFDVRNLI